MNKRGLLLVVLLLLVAGTGLLFWSVTSPVRGTAFVLANGEQIIFRDLSVGSNSTHCYGNIFQRMAARIPGPIGDKLSGDTRAEAWTYKDTDVAFWFLYRGAKRPISSLNIRLSDDDGFEASPFFETREFQLKEGETGLYLNAGILPRRSRTMTLHLSERSTAGTLQPLGKLRITNPLFEKYPQWRPEALPATRTFGDFAVTLDELTVELDASITNFNRTIEPANTGRFRLRVTESGRPSDKWMFFGARCSDATGESTHAWYTSWESTEEGHLKFAAKWPLWPGEKTAKLQTLWVRREAPPPERTMVFYGVTLPPIQAASVTIVSTNHPLGEIHVSCRPSSYPPTGERILELFSRDPRFYRYEDREVNCYYFQAARDDRTNELERIDARSFRLPAGARTVDVSVHLPEAKRADFVVSPRILRSKSREDSLER